MTDTNDLKLAEKLFGKKEGETLPGTSYRYEGEARGNSENGMCLISLSGETVSGDEKQAQMMPVGNCSVFKGQKVIVTVTDGKPMVTEVIGWGDNADLNIGIAGENAREALEAAETAEDAAAQAAQDAAAAAQAAADAKYEVETMSSYFIVDETGRTGAYIASTAGNFNSGANVRIYSGGMQIRNNTEVLADFTASNISIGNQTAKITFCGGKGIIEYKTDPVRNYMAFRSSGKIALEMLTVVPHTVTQENITLKSSMYSNYDAVGGDQVAYASTECSATSASGVNKSCEWNMYVGTTNGSMFSVVADRISLRASSFRNIIINGKSLLDWIYPVGTVYSARTSTSPASRFGGTWVAITGRFPYYNASIATGGASTHSHVYRTLMTSYYGGLVGPDSGGIALYDYPSSAWRRGNVGNAEAQGQALNTALTSGYGIGQAMQSDTSASVSASSSLPPYQSLYAWYRSA